jgi:hypothetical protein
MMDNDLPTTSFEIVHTLFPAGGRDILKRKPVLQLPHQKLRTKRRQFATTEN